MKTTVFVLFTLLAAGTLKGSPPCDTILLKSGKMVPAHAIAVTASEVRYQRCADSSNVVYGFPIGFVEGIISGREFRPIAPDGQEEKAGLKTEELDSTTFDSDKTNPTVTQPVGTAAGMPARGWIFRRKTDGVERRLAQGQVIRLRIEKKNGSYRKQIGRLYDLNADSLYLSDKKQIVVATALKDINRIELLNPKARPYGMFAQVAFWLLMGVGLGILLIALLFFAFFSALTGSRDDKEIHESLKPFYLSGALYLVAGIAFGMGYLAVASSKAIPAPSAAWTLEIDTGTPVQDGEQPVP